MQIYKEMPYSDYPISIFQKCLFLIKKVLISAKFRRQVTWLVYISKFPKLKYNCVKLLFSRLKIASASSDLWTTPKRCWIGVKTEIYFFYVCLNGETIRIKSHLLFSFHMSSIFPMINFSWIKITLKNSSLTHFIPLVSFITPWKYNLGFSDVFRGYRKRPLAWNGLTGYLYSH